MSDPATNENLREGRGERPSAGEQQGGTVKKGWTAVPLGELCDVLDNKRKPITKRDRETGEYPYYGATGIKDYVSGYIFDEPLVLVGEDGAKWASGDQTAFAIEGKCWVNNHAHVLRPHRTRLIDNWLIHFFFYSDLSEFVSGLTVPKLNQGNLREILIPLPPLAEQQRIVGLLDEAFEGLATAKANAEKNLQNARALFESHLQSVFTQRGPGWVEKSLVDVCTFINGRAYKKDEMLSVGKYPLLRVGNFFTNRDWYYSNLELDADKYCDNGDLLYAWSASFGPRVWGGGKVIYHYHIWKVLPHATVVETRFLLHLLEWDVDEIKKAHGTGTTMMHVSKGSMESRVVPIPPLKEQAAIVSLLDDLREETHRLSRLYEQKLAALEALKKSLLHQAFTGEL